MNKTILIIEDEEDIRDIIYHYLKKEGYSVKEAANGYTGINTALNERIDLIILDLMLPDISGYDVCREICKNRNIPIIMLTARNDIVDKIRGLEIGADDYITKPFDIREVMARVSVCLRRIEGVKSIVVNEHVIEVNSDVKINKESREVFKSGEVIKLKPKEYDLLLTFAENKNIVMSREKLLERVWEYDFEGGSRTVDVHVQRLRKKLDTDGNRTIIETIFGVGYRM
ncbi:response regulator transcription factor [Clostridium sp. DSM 8431]|uniref:response regulator transcription factor n=1 Tax=Clostridium sp. DSM 8431 TaxID=1761781 RepID=UPI000B7E155E|nr:response regulator transcription factor [Clostridium sp. DSM 8431]